MLNHVTAKILLAIVLLHEISYQIIIPIIEPLLQHIQISGGVSTSLLQGINIALFTIGAAIGAPILGWLSDRNKRKTLLITCLLLLLLSTVMLSAALFFKSLWLFGCGRFFSGLAGGEIAVIQGLFAAASIGKQRAVYFSQVALMLTLGTIVGPMAGGFLADMPPTLLPSLQWPFVCVGLLSILALLLIRPMTFNSPTLALETKQSPQAFLWLIGSFFLLETVWSFYFQLVPVSLKNTFALSSARTGTLMGVMGTAMCLALLAYPWLAKKTSTKCMVDVSLGLCIIAGVIKLLAFEIDFLIISMVFMAIGVALSYTAIMAAYANTVKLSYQGAAMGLTLSVMAIAWTLTGSFARALFDYSTLMCNSLIIGGFILTLLIFQKPFSKSSCEQIHHG